MTVQRTKPDCVTMTRVLMLNELVVATLLLFDPKYAVLDPARCLRP